ncbi:MAG: flagellar biosynthesis protein, partial [Lentisphaerota bacterium]
MKGMRDGILRMAGAAMLVGLLGSGCATNRGILNVQVEKTKNPSEGRTVTIVSVNDARVFEEAPRVSSTPSLKGAEITDKSITSRAIARKRNGFGKAMGDILLPEGRTVEQLVREALVKSFRDSGYRVLEAGEVAADGEKAIPVEADIEQFWSWCT